MSGSSDTVSSFWKAFLNKWPLWVILGYALFLFILLCIYAPSGGVHGGGGGDSGGSTWIYFW